MRRRILASVGKPLPYDAEVEWLETNGGQYIDTLILPSTTMVIGFDFHYLKNVQQSRLYSANSDGAEWSLFHTSKDNLTARHGGNKSSFETLMFTISTIRYQGVSGGGYTTINGKTVTCKVGSAGVKSTIVLFGRNNNGVVYYQDYKMYCRLMGFYIEENESKLIDLIPVRFTNDNGVSEGAMFDRVSGKLFYNQGTGAFIIGPDKVSQLGGGW